MSITQTRVAIVLATFVVAGYTLAHYVYTNSATFWVALAAGIAAGMALTRLDVAVLEPVTNWIEHNIYNLAIMAAGLALVVSQVIQIGDDWGRSLGFTLGVFGFIITEKPKELLELKV